LTLGSSSDRNSTIHSIFSNEDHILWFQRHNKNHVHILISLSSNSTKSHFKAWAHAYVLAKLVSGIPIPAWKTEAQILEKEAGEVSQALKIVNMAFEQGVGIERALVGKGWDLERSMMCSHLDFRRREVSGSIGIDEKLGDAIEKRA
jgi:hypothetical protein